MFDGNSQFPTTYSDIKTNELVYAYDAGPGRLRHVIEGLTEEELKAHPREGKWSIFEIVIHLSDSEIMGAARARQTFTQAGRKFAFYDQEIWANQIDYQNLNMDEFGNALKLFEALRTTTSVIFHKATEEEWNKTGIHAELGEMTLRQLLELYADHSERHIEQILTLRGLLNKSLDIPAILEKRLY